MSQNQITVQIGEEKKRYPLGVTFLDVAKEFAGTKKYDIVLAQVDNKLFELNKK